jgi:hypothetical protein
VSPVRCWAMAGFAIRTNLRSPMTAGGMVAFAAIAALGPIAAVKNGQGPALDPDLLFYGYITGGLFVLRSGLAQQRECGLQTYLRHNFTTAAEHGLGAVLSLLGTWLILTGALFLLALAYSAGDAASATWYAWSFGLALALLLPFVIMAESVSTLRIPLLLPVIGVMALAVVLTVALGEARMAAILVFSAERGDPASSMRLAGRVGVVVPAGMGLYLATVWARSRAAATPQEVTSGH